MYESLDDFVNTRKKAIANGLESPALAALMVEKFAEGMCCAGVDLIEIADGYCIEIDAEYKNNRKRRYEAVAELDLSKNRE